MADRETLSKYLRRVTGELRQTQQRLHAMERREAEPVAIVGMSCRFPGGVGSAEDLWDLVVAGADAIGPFPTNRGWRLGSLFHPDPAHGGTSYASEGGFIEGADRFDADFFQINPLEAQAMDPAQRHLLEVSWEALENAAVDPLSLRGEPVGVFTGISTADYSIVPKVEPQIEGYFGFGCSPSFAAGRISYFLGVEGPALTVDTACSSSLVAMHLAMRALRSGECTLGLVGGATVRATPKMFTEFSRLRGLAPDGRSKSFSDEADGTGWGEGVGVLVLERLSDAERNGRRPLALLRGSSINQDGASNGQTAPNGTAQERVIRQALADARLAPRDIDAVEAHGTGTSLGDPIEAGALIATYGQERERPLYLGSIKSNVGHTEAAAGVAGVIKVAMAMRAGSLPRTLHAERPSSKIDWASGSVELLSESQPWLATGRPRRAGVSSFGASGTNAHVVVEEAPPRREDERGGEGSSEPVSSEEQAFAGPLPFVLSAKSRAALRESAARLRRRLEADPSTSLVDLAWSLASTRAALEHRGVAIADDPARLSAALEALARGSSSPDLALGRARRGKLAYLFTGQGSQHVGMGRELYDTHVTYRKTLDQVCELFEDELEHPLREVIFGRGRAAGAKLADTTYAQPALFATEVALYRLLERAGLRPDLLAGHSIGELVAAHVAGVLSLEHAVRLVAARARSMGELPAGGAMFAIEADEREALGACAGREDAVSIAAVNAPRSVVISGELGAVEEVAALFERQGRQSKRLAVSHAFHSLLMEPMLDQFERVARDLDYREPEIPVVSNVSGELLTAAQ
ncbi:MAG TPA: type I polyketide synthase, partial [Solirubrobacterales bacterium]|nr:type I polyketide synthase [Solirubrobacterales bacterium]